MELTEKCKIYEFSRKFLEPKWSERLNKYVTTGFDKEIGWETQQVPREIANAVHNNQFRINDNYPPQPNDIALIARELNKYAVLAVATELIDDKDRPLVGYRYFWLEKPPKNHDIDGIGTLLKWWINQDYLYFELKPSSEYTNPKKPYITSFLSKQNLLDYYSEDFLLKDIQTRSNETSINLFIGYNYFSEYEQFHSIALLLNQEYKVSLSWAFNVKKLECPEQFTLIYSENKLIINNLNSSDKKSQKFSEESFSNETLTDTNLKRCLIELARNKNLDSNFKKLSNYLQEIDSHNWNWESILDKTVLNNNEDITTARYRALLAILMPFPEIFEWLYWLKEQKNKHFLQAGIHRQNQFIEFLKKQSILENSKIENKIYTIIIELLLEDISTQKKYNLIKEYLLIQSQNHWKGYFQDYGQRLFFQLYFDEVKTNLTPDKLAKKVLADWKLWEKNKYLSPEQKEYYEWIARLFAQINSYSLSAFFYQLSWEEIPIDIYAKVQFMLVSPKKSSRTSGLIHLSISTLKEEIKLLFANLISSRVKSKKK